MSQDLTPMLNATATRLATMAVWNEPLIEEELRALKNLQRVIADYLTKLEEAGLSDRPADRL